MQPVKDNAAERRKGRQLEAATPSCRDTSDPDWAALGNGQAREFYHQVMAEVIYELQREFEHKLKGQAEQIRTVELQLAELRGELRHQANGRAGQGDRAGRAAAARA